MKFLDTLASYIPSIIVDELQSQVESGGHKTAPYRIEFDTAHNDASFSLSLSLSKFDKPPFLTYSRAEFLGYLDGYEKQRILRMMNVLNWYPNKPGGHVLRRLGFYQACTLRGIRSRLALKVEGLARVSKNAGGRPRLASVAFDGRYMGLAL